MENNTKETNKEYDYVSTITMGEKEFNDLGNVVYASFIVITRIFLIILVIDTILTLLSGMYDFDWIMFLAIMTSLIIVIFLITCKNAKDLYRRNLVAEGREEIVHKTSFEDKIVSETDNHQPVEYDYESIISIKETEKLYLLGMKYNLYLIVDKNIKNDSEESDFVEYIIKKCPNMKKKKVIKIMNNKKISIIYTGIAIGLFIINLILYIAL